MTMIEIQREQVVTLTQATHHIPARRKGKKVAVSTPWRWAKKGVRGVRLETLQVGGTRCTSLEAIQRFCDRLTALGDDPALPTPSRCQDAALQRAERELDKAGI